MKQHMLGELIVLTYGMLQGVFNFEGTKKEACLLAKMGNYFEIICRSSRVNLCQPCIGCNICVNRAKENTPYILLPRETSIVLSNDYMTREEVFQWNSSTREQRLQMLMNTAEQFEKTFNPVTVS